MSLMKCRRWTTDEDEAEADSYLGYIGCYWFVSIHTVIDSDISFRCVIQWQRKRISRLLKRNEG